MAYQLDLSGRVALVTGASSGLGAQFARTLAKAGAAVVLASRRVERLKELRAHIEAEGGNAHVVALDVTAMDSIRAAVAHAETEVGPIDILINNSGVSNTQRLQEVEEDDFDFIFDTNVRGAFFVAQEVGKRMMARARGAAPGTYTGGRIINIASMAGLKVLPQIGVYCMSKAAVVHMTKAMALEWGRFGINVNAICPGYIDTEINHPTGKPSKDKNWCRCCRASALAIPRTWTPCWSCWPAPRAVSSTGRSLPPMMGLRCKSRAVPASPGPTKLARPSWPWRRVQLPSPPATLLSPFSLVPGPSGRTRDWASCRSRWPCDWTSRRTL